MITVSAAKTGAAGGAVRKTVMTTRTYLQGRALDRLRQDSAR